MNKCKVAELENKLKEADKKADFFATHYNELTDKLTRVEAHHNNIVSGLLDLSDQLRLKLSEYEKTLDNLEEANKLTEEQRNCFHLISDEQRHEREKADLKIYDLEKKFEQIKELGEKLKVETECYGKAPLETIQSIIDVATAVIKK